MYALRLLLLSCTFSICAGDVANQPTEPAASTTTSTAVHVFLRCPRFCKGSVQVGRMARLWRGDVPAHWREQLLEITTEKGVGTPLSAVSAEEYPCLTPEVRERLQSLYPNHELSAINVVPQIHTSAIPLSAPGSYITNPQAMPPVTIEISMQKPEDAECIDADRASHEKAAQVRREMQRELQQERQKEEARRKETRLNGLLKKIREASDEK